MPQAREVVVPDAPEREEHHEVAHPAGDPPFGCGEGLGPCGQGEQPPDDEEDRDDHRVAGDTGEDGAHGGELRSVIRPDHEGGERALDPVLFSHGLSFSVPLWPGSSASCPALSRGCMTQERVFST